MTNKPIILVGFVRIEIEDHGGRRVVDSVAMVGFSGVVVAWRSWWLEWFLLRKV
jgi:hypothetical protein